MSLIKRASIKNGFLSNNNREKGYSNVKRAHFENVRIVFTSFSTYRSLLCVIFMLTISFGLPKIVDICIINRVNTSNVR